MMKELKTAYEKGLKGEEIALHHLLQKGYVCLFKRYKRKGGEVDLIVQKDEILVFVEVRLRKHTFDAAESITLKKQQRLTTIARHFIMHELGDKAYSYFRFDVVLINQNGIINHIENAFEGQE